MMANKKMLQIGLGLLLVVALGFVIFQFLGNSGPIDAFIYNSGSKLMLVKNNNVDKPIEILDDEINGKTYDTMPFDDLYTLVKLSPDKKYLYFLTPNKGDEKEELKSEGDTNQVLFLKRIELSKLNSKEDIQKNSELIGEKVVADSQRFQFLDDGTFIYHTRDGEKDPLKSYYFDGKESVFIRKDWVEVRNGKYIEFYDIKSNDYYYYVLDPKKMDETIELAKKVRFVFLSNDTHFYIVQEYDATYSIYSCVLGKERELIAKNVSFYLYKDGILYYLEKEKLIDQEEEIYASKLFALKDGKANLIKENVVDISFNKGGYVAFNTMEILEKTKGLEEKDYDLKRFFEHYIVAPNSDKAIYVNPSKFSNREFFLFPFESKVYMLSTNKLLYDTYILSVADVDNGTVGEFREVAKGELDILKAYKDRLYYKELKANNRFDLYLLKDGGTKKIAENILGYQWFNNENGNILVINEEYEKTLDVSIYDADGKLFKDFKDVAAYRNKENENVPKLALWQDESRIYSVNSYNLYQYDGKETKRIGGDARWMWSQPNKVLTEHFEIPNNIEGYKEISDVLYSIREQKKLGKWVSSYVEGEGRKVDAEHYITLEYKNDGVVSASLKDPLFEDGPVTGTWKKVDEENHTLTIDGSEAKCYFQGDYLVVEMGNSKTYFMSTAY